MEKKINVEWISKSNVVELDSEVGWQQNNIDRYFRLILTPSDNDEDSSQKKVVLNSISYLKTIPSYKEHGYCQISFLKFRQLFHRE